MRPFWLWLFVFRVSLLDWDDEEKRCAFQEPMVLAAKGGHAFLCLESGV